MMAPPRRQVKWNELDAARPASKYYGPVDVLADELLLAINDFPGERPFSRDPARGEPEARVAAAYNRLYCELHDLGGRESHSSYALKLCRAALKTIANSTAQQYSRRIANETLIELDKRISPKSGLPL